MAGGAAILMWLERGPELSRRIEKLENVTRLYNLIVNQTWTLIVNQTCQTNASTTSMTTMNSITEKLKPLLNELSKTHEYDDRFTEDDQLWTDDPLKLRARWTYPAALLYSLTVITTTGTVHKTKSNSSLILIQFKLRAMTRVGCLSVHQKLNYTLHESLLDSHWSRSVVFFGCL